MYVVFDFDNTIQAIKGVKVAHDQPQPGYKGSCPKWDGAGWGLVVMYHAPAKTRTRISTPTVVQTAYCLVDLGRTIMIWSQRISAAISGVDLFWTHEGGTMQQDGTNPSATGDLGVMPPKRPRLRINIVSLVAWLVMVALVVGAWFAGQWYERRTWEPKYDELEMRNATLREDNQSLDAANARLNKDKDRLEGQLDGYVGIAEVVNRRLGDTCADKKSFITPDDGSVAAKVLTITGGSSSDANEQWSGYDAMYDWVRTNIKYSYDSRLPRLPVIPNAGLLYWQNDFWRMPSETLEDETGDCEDMAVLLASMIKDYTQSTYTCRVIIWHSQESGHAAVAIPVTGGSLAILDPAGNQTIGFGGHQSISATAIEWLGKWPSESGIHVSAIFSDTECEAFASTDEFVAWASSRA